MRATRAYLAGVGTSGSLLAGAAVVFVLASAIVAFRGWPQVGAQPATAAVTVPASGATNSRDGRRLTVALATPAHVGRPARSAGGTLGRPGSKHADTRPVGAAPGSRSPVPAGSSRAATAGSSGTCAGSGCAVSTARGGLTSATNNATNTASQGVSNAGSNVDSTVSGVVGTVAGSVGSASPPAGGVVQNTGTTAENAVSGATTTASGVITTVSNTLPGG